MTAALRVLFDQNCVNARGTDQELREVQRLHDEGRIVLVANLRNRLELGPTGRDGPAKVRMRERLALFEETKEVFRLGVSPLGEAVLADATEEGSDAVNPVAVWSVVFPGSPFQIGGQPMDSGQNSLHDVMYIVNAHESDVDVFLTREKALLSAGSRLRSELGLRPTIESPRTLLLRFAKATDPVGGS
ncbi:hypothetical protein BH09MYX1_BH09MYX1_37560 [soil metagenome]